MKNFKSIFNFAVVLAAFFMLSACGSSDDGPSAEEKKGEQLSHQWTLSTITSGPTKDQLNAELSGMKFTISYNAETKGGVIVVSGAEYPAYVNGEKVSVNLFEGVSAWTFVGESLSQLQVGGTYIEGGIISIKGLNTEGASNTLEISFKTSATIPKFIQAPSSARVEGMTGDFEFTFGS